MKKENVEYMLKHARDPKVKTLQDHLGIEVTHIGDGEIRGTMPVDHRTTQLAGILHGGASVAFAENLASIGGWTYVDMHKETVVGLEINANHLRSAKSGSRLSAVAKPIHVGRKTQVWSIEIKNEENKLVCVSRCTLAVVQRTDLK